MRQGRPCSVWWLVPNAERAGNKTAAAETKNAGQDTNGKYTYCRRFVLSPRLLITGLTWTPTIGRPRLSPLPPQRPPQPHRCSFAAPSSSPGPWNTAITEHSSRAPQTTYTHVHSVLSPLYPRRHQLEKRLDGTAIPSKFYSGQCLTAVNSTSG